MFIGVPKEIKNHEYRVGLTPQSVGELVSNGHTVMIQKMAGHGIGASDDIYRTAGAIIASTAEEVFQKSDMIVKVKEPQAIERKMLRQGQILFTYLHLAPDPEQTKDLIESGAVCIAYETVTDPYGKLPLLAPMSQVAGRLSVQAGATALEKAKGGAGILLGGVPGVASAKVVVIGGGVVGEHAIAMAIGLGADVTVLDRNLDVLAHLSERFGPALKTLYSTKASVTDSVVEADLVIGAVLVAGATAPKLVTEYHVKQMKKGSVLVDVAIDQGGCFATSRATTHTNPTYMVDDVVHYCVANMPGAVPRTSTYALNNATLPYIIALANRGYKNALLSTPNFLAGLNVIDGKITCKAVSEALGYDYYDARELLLSYS